MVGLRDLARSWLRWGSGLLLGFVCGSAAAQPGTGVLRVSTGGSDVAGCGSAAAPCRNPQHAVSIALPGDEIRIAQGTYTFQPALDPCSATLGTSAVVCVVNRAIVLRGGYDGVNWSAPAFGPGATVLSGENVRRGLLAEDTAGHPTRTVLEVSNLTVRHGRATPRSLGSGDALLFAFGGGLEGLFARIVLRDVHFESNVAQGADSGGPYGGAGVGGAVSLRKAPSGTLLERVVFRNNQALGGQGSQRGGYGQGGALFTYQSSLSGQDWSVVGNVAQAGGSNGSGVYLGESADGQGGGIAFQLGTQATVERLVGASNSARGGAASLAGGTAGSAFGGGILVEGGSGADASAVTLRDLRLEDNEALGASAFHGGYASGGGLHAVDADLTVERARLVRNRASGGDGLGGQQGPAGGGGLAATRSTLPVAAAVRDSVIAANLARVGVGSIVGGGGGGLWIQGIPVDLEHVTLAVNELSADYLQGHGLVALSWIDPAQVTLAHSIVSDHAVPAGPAALHVQAGSSLHFATVLEASNLDLTNQGDPGSGTFTGTGSVLSAASVGYRAPAAPQRNFRLRATSPAIDAAPGSPSLLDLDRGSRDAVPDLGAYEYSPGWIFREDFETATTGSWIPPS